MQHIQKEHARVGLAAGSLAAGALVTLSVNKVTGDRTFSNAIWEIVSVNDGHALLKCRALGDWLSESLQNPLVLLSEYDFFAADELALAVDPAPKLSH